MSSGRSGLLADIQKGKKLKSKNEQKKLSDRAPAAKRGGKKAGKDQEAGKAPPPPSGDIFSDLISALNRRRKGIAEKAKEVSAKEGSEDAISVPTMDGEWDP